MEYQAYFNKEEALQRVRGNEKTLLLMINLFLGSKEIDKLEASLTERNIEESMQMAHAVKGLSGNLSFPLLYEASARLNQELKDGIYNDESVAEYRQVLKDTQTAVKALCGIE